MVLRKLTLALLGMGVMLPGLSHALAVRDIQTKSALGQPLRVEIELSDLGDLSSEDIKVGIATQEDFARLGIERVLFLTELRFDVIVNSGGRSFIRISSSKRVSEPFLDFVIRISWPGNTRLQELPILLDPPVVASSRVPEPAAPVVAVVEPAPAAKPEPAPAAAPVVAVAMADTDEGATYQVRRRDSLWSIAQRVRPGRDVSVPRMMQALYKANPQAFVANNINLLRDGQTLRVPTLGEVRSAGEADAARLLSSQNAASATDSRKLSRKQINATATASKPAAATVQPRIEMKLVAPVGGKSAAGHPEARTAAKSDTASGSGAKGVVAGKAAGAGHPRPAADLAGQVAVLQNKLKSNDTKIAMQNARLAQLEAQLKARSAQEQAKHKNADKHLERKAIATLACGVATQSFLSTEAKAADPAPAKAEGGSMMPVFGGLALLVIIGAIFFLKSRSRKPQAPSAPPVARPAPAAPAAKPAPVAAPAPAPAPEVKKPTDALEEAQAYFNLERFPQAVGVLNKALAQTPDRADLHLMLLEIFARQQDRQSFQEQYARLEALGELEALFKADEIKARLPEEVKAAPAAPVQEGIVDYVPSKPKDEAGPSLEDLEKDFALSLSQPNLKAVDVEIRETAPVSAPAVEEIDSLLDGGLEFSFSKSEPAEAAPQSEPAAMDFAFETPAAEPAQVDQKFEELSLDSFDAFLAEQTAAPAPVIEQPAAAAEPDFDFDKALSDFQEETGVAEPEAPAAAIVEPVIEAAAADVVDLAEGLELEEFNVSQINLPVTDAPLRSETQTGLEALDGDFNFDDFAKTPEPVVEAAPAPAAFESFESVDMGSAAAAFDAELSGQGADDLSLDEEAGFDVADDASDALSSLDKEFTFLAATDENATRLELARAYVDMGDKAAARDLLEEVVADGKENQKQEAQGMLMRIA
ncbi:MAG TPA: FimV/HubP family polar landmark protein [Fluviicoccus sp.]|nr:FimV/HubP family polar landmark protein [Fluviicoccus sp.]